MLTEVLSVMGPAGGVKIGVIIPGHWQSQRRKIREAGRHSVVSRAFHDSPAVILSTHGTRRLKINLLKPILSHIADVEIARGSVKRKSPRIPQSQSPDFRRVIRVSHERIIRRDAIGRDAAFDVNSKQLAEKDARIPAAVLGITLRAAVARADVEITIRPE